MEFNLDTSLKELYDYGLISIRTYNCLYYAGYSSLGIILDNIETPIDLLKLRNFGRKSYTEIEPILNYFLRNNSIVNQRQFEMHIASLDEVVIDIITESYNDIVNGESRECKYLQVTYPQPLYLHKLVMGDLNQMLDIVKNFSRKDNLEIRHLYKQYIDVVLERMENAKEAENSIYVEYKKKSSEFALKMDYFTYEQIANYFLTPQTSDYLEKRYHRMINETLSVRSKNFIAKYLPHFQDLIIYVDEPFANYHKICPGKNMTKTLLEIFSFNKKFKNEFDRVANYTNEDIQIESLKSTYPYLTSNQRSFVYQYKTEYNHAPLLFLMFHYLRLSEKKSDKIYSMFHGIFDGKHRTLIEIAEVMGVSRERIRQIVFGKIDVQKTELVTDKDWERYADLFKQTFIYEKSDDYIRIKEKERLPDDFDIFASLVSLVSDFNVLNVEGRSILIKKYCDWDVKECLNKLITIINSKYSKDTYLPIENLLSNISVDFMPAFKELFKYIAADIYELEVTSDDQMYFPQNFIDISEEVYNILENNGKPMHVEDIFKEFKKRYPDHKYTDPLQIKPSMFKHEHIKAIGKSSCYALDSWEDVYFGSIRDLLVDLLSASDIPLHIDDIFESVTEHYPNTTKASLLSTMEDEEQHRFVEFEGLHFGLTAKDYPAEYVVATSYQRYSFEERLQMFTDFVEEYHRFPVSSGSEQETSLNRWVYNISNRLVYIDDERKRKLDEIIAKYDALGYPRTATEYEFLIKCQDLKDYICKYHTLPSNNNAPELYAWLRRSRENYDSFTDKRRQYMTDLLNYILYFGFSI